MISIAAMIDLWGLLSFGPISQDRIFQLNKTQKLDIRHSDLGGVSGIQVLIFRYQIANFRCNLKNVFV